MADTNNPAFTPPMNRITDDDPMIIRVPLDKVEIGARKSQQPAMGNSMTLRHIKNGQ